MLRRRTARCALLALACATLLAACGTPPGPEPVSDAARAGGSNEHGLARLRNPLEGDAAAIAAGGALFAGRACAGCHGAAGGGGMCPPLVNDAWVYGDDDTTLYHLIREGSMAMRAHGYVRGDAEKVAGDMPPFGGALSEQETWQLIAWIRANHAHAAPTEPATR
ncbi:c-type cytochrome [Dokdonella fugitiva]|uniref:Cytochrome c n=1 Tax=Dokdonella fugitiva TaxID=328517 RepID=A0A4R2IEV5_9GAMM|nr:cytochrome c [Dokdonella fugitiva]TCO41195.1 cytochrome c [Dokdonella fugitiva]